ncbi:hypothetical protein AALO_G00137860 [Alosa alosa]|uniref:Uncharacterized protein n=1 Tax=Alosa alosa TaxID=278164 RepID=A0AAV6GHD5_9TELE|nr:uncharacterized protein LOC121706457 [Alosa sapidissima]XP_048111139.1 uncharacterized protein LOC125302150 [Alosa alosa]KAG5274579.1 hypothetical protein AALO_G00137860 [Alosa alosa]
MFSFKTGVTLAVLAMLVVAVHCGIGEGTNSYNYDLHKMSDLTKLYNSKVYVADRMRRPLKGTTFQIGLISHSGVRVTLKDGTKWLVHKGDAFGISSQTVVVDARHMSNTWKIIETKNFQGSKTVSDFVKAGGTDYSLIFDNCHDASGRMFDQ